MNAERFSSFAVSYILIARLGSLSAYTSTATREIGRIPE